jgi:regulator of protease activity HflC (stomatin/prohibitin superfamily)
MFKTEEGLKAGKIFPNSTTLWVIGIIILGTLIGGASIDWIGFSCLGLAAILAVLTLNTAVVLPTVYFGVPTRLKKRIRKKDNTVLILEEGLNFVAPLVDDLLPENIKSKKLVTQEIEAKALSKDKLEVTLEGSVQYRPADLNVYIEMTKKTIEEGMVEAVESEVGKICGVKDSDVFVEERTEIEFLIRCVLQLKKPPHYYINRLELGTKPRDTDTGPFRMGTVLKKETIENLKLDDKKIKELVEKLSPKKWELKLDDDNEIDIISFYKDNVSRINLLFDLGADSGVEKLYGIKIATFRVAKLLFSKKAQEAFEKTRAAKAEMTAAEERFNKKKEILQGYIDMGLSPNQAVNLVETTTDVEGVNRQIISVEGSQQSDLLAFAKLFAGGTKGGDRK